jgi:hypothetical protein
MKLTEIPSDAIARIQSLRYDSILEKHEGPWRWADELEFGAPELLRLDGRHVLLPVEQVHHPNITLLRAIVSHDEKTLTLFLKDSTYSDGDAYEWLYAGRLAICERLPGTSVYVATVYHEWFIIENRSLVS